jgi:hypothetical protein
LDAPEDHIPVATVIIGDLPSGTLAELFIKPVLFWTFRLRLPLPHAREAPGVKALCRSLRNPTRTAICVVAES